MSAITNQIPHLVSHYLEMALGNISAINTTSQSFQDAEHFVLQLLRDERDDKQEIQNVLAGLISGMLRHTTATNNKG